MRYLSILLVLISLDSCDTLQNKSQETVKITTKQETEINAVNKEQNNNIDLNQFIKFLEEKSSLIPKKYYALLGLDSTIYEEFGNNYNISIKRKFGEKQILAITRKYYCNPIKCAWGIRLYIIENANLRRSEEFNYFFELDPTFSFEHEIFLIITDKVHDWEEIEFAMEATSEEYKVEFFIVLFEDKISKIEAFSSKELRLIRNYIFARHGYKFNSMDLKEYFSKYSWYTPKFDNVEENLSEIDKKIIMKIKTIEKK